MQHPIIRTIYLYLFSLVGLAFLIWGTVKFVNLGLKIFVFTKADQQNYNVRQPIMPIFPVPGGKEIASDDLISVIQKCEDKCDLSQEQKNQISNWLKDYKNWQEQEKNIDYKTQQRQQEASGALAAILVGLPLYLYHWRIIRRELKKTDA